MLKTYHLNGNVKYQGVSSYRKKKQLYYDIADSTLAFFNQKYPIKQYDKEGTLIKRFYYHKNKINPFQRLDFPSEFSFYEGEVLHGKANGCGRLYYLPNDNDFDMKVIYYGEFLDNKRHGEGTTYDLNGNITFTGTFRNDFPNGFGESFHSQHSYRGFWKNGKYHGDCQIWNNDRCVFNGKWHEFEGTTSFFGFTHSSDRINIDSGSLYYHGGFLHGRRHGIGKEFNEFSHLVYHGSWKHGQRHGYGNEFKFCPIYGEIIQYSGNFQYNQRSGFGIEWNMNSLFQENIWDTHNDLTMSYQGQWLHGKKHGTGTLFYGNDMKKFYGEFHQGHPFCGSVYYHPLSTNTNKVLYIGQVRNETFHGKGTMFSPSNKICFHGDWKQGLPFDKKLSLKNITIFTIYSSKNPKYQGDVMNGKFHGKGCLYSECNVIHCGEFYNGYIFDGKESYYNEKRQLCFKGVFKNERFWNGFSTSPLMEWKNGVQMKNYSFKNRQIQKYLETRDTKLLADISKKTLCSFLWRTFHRKCKGSKTRIVQKLQIEHSLRQRNPTSTPEQEYDLFGFKIENPVLGSDGNTYDLKSVEYLFERDKQSKDFLRIPYRYNADNKRYPCYPAMGNGKCLESYETTTYKCYELPNDRFILYHNRFEDNS